MKLDTLSTGNAGMLNTCDVLKPIRKPCWIGPVLWVLEVCWGADVLDFGNGAQLLRAAWK